MKKISESKIVYWLSLPYISARKQAKLLKHFGDSPIKLWNEFTKCETEIRKFVGDKAYEELSRYRSVEYIDASLEKLKNDGVSVITMLNPLYPKLLLEDEVNAPSVLYYRGSIELFNTTCVAMVGTRASTIYGRTCAKNIATVLADNGVTVVSGLATGIDAYAHEATLDAGGKTIAVLGSGLNKITPVGNIKLYERILESGGLVISEYKPDADATKYTFPARNRIISGLSKGVIVVEAGEKSGALITAKYATEQNREVFAVPGNVTSARSKGCNDLIFDGANMVRDGYDVLNALRIKHADTTKKQEIIVDKEQKKLYSFFESGAKTIDELAELSGMALPELSAVLLDMELDGIIEKQSANLYALATRT